MPDLSDLIHLDDKALALAATHGDAKAFRALYTRHLPYVHTFVTKLLGAGPDREDATQEVFLQLHRALPNFRGDARLSTFLRRIAMNVAIDQLRKRYRYQRFDYDSDVLDAVVDARQDPERHSSARQELQSLLHHVNGIAPDKRCALLLVAVAGLSLNDAAAQIGTNRDRVKQRIVRARRELVELMNKNAQPSAQ